MSRLLWNECVHYRVHKSLPLVSVLGHMILVYTVISYVLDIHFNITLSFHLHLGLPSGLFPSGFSTKILYAFLSYLTCYMPSNFILIGYLKYIQFISIPLDCYLLSDQLHIYS
jgi:hypothetical protein